MNRAFKVLTVAVILTIVTASAQAQTWSKRKAIRWHKDQPWLVGCNFNPSTAINQLEMWQADSFDPETIDRELGWAADIGFNFIRVYLHDMAWTADSQGLLKRIDKFLTITDKHNIKVMFVLLDSCWDPFPKLGKQRDPKPHVHNSGWVQSPHLDLLKDLDRHDELAPYVKGVVGRFAKDKRVIIWDLYNEPGNTNASSYGKHEPANKSELGLALLKKLFVWARDANPTQPLTAGVWNEKWGIDEDVPELNKFMLANSDIITFHCYGGPGNMIGSIAALKPYDRPMICTEYMSRGTGSTFQNILPILKKDRVGAANWGLVAGKTQTQYPWASWRTQFTAEPELWFHEVFRIDGKPYDPKETQFIRDITASKTTK